MVLATDAFAYQTAVEIGHYGQHRFNLLLCNELLQEIEAEFATWLGNGHGESPELYVIHAPTFV